jgi:hypothetical protein
MLIADDIDGEEEVDYVKTGKESCREVYVFVGF